ncbi:DUF3995 domain-containing protein [Actinokineospora auranticolor]|nr:DUF3995 domain-containing protein [Actinokineospora auranticolor]
MPRSLATTGRTTFFAYATAAWAFAFAAVHVYWAVGGSLGLPPGLSVRGNTPLFVIDVIAVPMCVAGGVLALALVRPFGARLARKPLLVGAWGMSVLCLVHSVPAVLQAALLLVSGDADTLTAPERFSFFGYEPYWFVGGVLTGLAAFGYQRATRGR